MESNNGWYTNNLHERSLDNLCDFKVSFNPYRFQITSFKESCKNQLKELNEKYKSLYLSYSGGLDSTFYLKIISELKLPIVPVIVKTPFNSQEIKQALYFCNKFNVTPIIIEMSGVEFMAKLIPRTILKGQFSVIGGIAGMIADILNSYVLTATCDPHGWTPGFINSVPASDILHFSEVDQYPHDKVIRLFSHNIEVMYSLINDLDYSIPLQAAKAKLYELEYIDKVHYHHTMHAIEENFRGFKIKNDSFYINRHDFLKLLRSASDN